MTTTNYKRIIFRSTRLGDGVPNAKLRFMPHSGPNRIKNNFYALKRENTRNFWKMNFIANSKTEFSKFGVYDFNGISSFVAMLNFPFRNRGFAMFSDNLSGRINNNSGFHTMSRITLVVHSTNNPLFIFLSEFLNFLKVLGLQISFWKQKHFRPIRRNIFFSFGNCFRFGFSDYNSEFDLSHRIKNFLSPKMRNHEFVFIPKIEYQLVAESRQKRDKLREANQNSLTFPTWCPGWDSNPQALRRNILSVVRLPFRHPGKFSLFFYDFYELASSYGSLDRVLSSFLFYYHVYRH